MKLNFINLQMRDGGLTAGIVAAGAALAGQGVNAAMVGKSNLRTRQFAEEMYLRQRNDALADWNMQNAYNSPAAQMARFKDAGLNPHLIYGQMGETPSVRSTSAQPWKSEAPQFDGGDVVGKYLSAKQQVVQTDNLAKQQELMAAEIELKRAQTISQYVQAQTGTFDLNLKNALKDRNIQLADYSLEAKEKDIRKQDQDYEFARSNQSMKIQQNDLDAAQKAQSLTQGVQNILQSKLTQAKTEQETRLLKKAIENASKDGDIKALDAKLAKDGIRPGDPLWYRHLKNLANKVLEFIE